MSFLGPLVPLFWISGDISSGFQSQSGFCLILPYLPFVEVHSLRSRGGTLLGFEQAITRTEDVCTTIVSATRLFFFFFFFLIICIWYHIDPLQTYLQRPGFFFFFFFFDNMHLVPYRSTSNLFTTWQNIFRCKFNWNV